MDDLQWEVRERAMLEVVSRIYRDWQSLPRLVHLCQTHVGAIANRDITSPTDLAIRPNELKRFMLMPVLGLALTGCMVGPDYEKPDTVIPDQWRMEYKQSAELANTGWWSQFNDPVLDELILSALKNNREIRIAAARVEEFAELVDVTRSGLFPQIGYDGAADRS